MKDHFGHELELGNIVAHIDRGRSITLARVTRFTKKKVEITFPAREFDYDTKTMKDCLANSLVMPELLLVLPTSPVIEQLVLEKKL